MKHIKIAILIIAIIIVFSPSAFCQDASSAPKINLSLDEILDSVEKQYSAPGFAARFFQTSTIQAMDITDTAAGQIFVKRPGMMRWEYETPDLQTITTDGRTLWIYRPEDRQVMIGKAPVFFGGGKGAGFLSDMAQIRRQFYITLEKNIKENNYQLKLFPLTKTFDVSVIYLSIAAQTFNVVRIVTYNSFGDKTRIDLSNVRTNQQLDDMLFNFKIPDGVEILHLDE